MPRNLLERNALETSLRPPKVCTFPSLTISAPTINRRTTDAFVRSVNLIRFNIVNDEGSKRW